MAKDKNDTICLIAAVLLVIGGLNWGLVGLSSLLNRGDWNIVNLVLGGFANGLIVNLVYVLVGIAGVFKLFKLAEMFRQ